MSKAPKLNDLVIGILTRLSHTPISAAGINQGLHLTTGSQENWHRIGNSLAPKDTIWRALYEEPGMTSISIMSPRPGRFAGFTNVSVHPSVLLQNGIYVTSNFDYKPSPESETASLVREFIRNEWRSAIKEATRVAEVIFRKLIWEQA